MLNHIIIMGRLTRDPELRQTGTGRAVASFSLAVDRDFKDKATGDRVTDFIDVVAWQHTAEFVSRYFTKGRMAVVEGRLQMEDWTDKEGNKRRSARVVANSVYFGDSRRDGDNSYGQGFTPPPQANAAPSFDQSPPAQSGYTPPATSSYGNYSAPQSNNEQFQTLTGNEEELPF